MPMTPKKNLPAPLIHLNGSGAGSLNDQLHVAHDAGRKFQDALSAMFPHGRDYYPEGEEAYPRARAEHEERMRKVAGIIEDLEDIAHAIVVQKWR